MSENKKEKYVPVKVINRIKSYPDKLLQTALMICSICLILSLFFNAMLFYKVDDIEIQMEKLSEKDTEKTPAKSGGSVIFAANTLTLDYSFNSLDPLEFIKAEGESQDIPHLSFVNISPQTYTNVNATINDKSLQALVEQLNKQDSAYQYELNVNNEQCSLKITNKDENSEAGEVNYDGSLGANASYILGNGESSLNLNLSDPVMLILNRFAFLQLKPATNIEINIVGTDLSNQNKMSVFTLEQTDAQVELGDDYTPGHISYSLTCKNIK